MANDVRPATAASSKSQPTRQRILDAAEQVLGERGYAATRLADVATVAGAGDLLLLSAPATNGSKR